MSMDREVVLRSVDEYTKELLSKREHIAAAVLIVSNDNIASNAIEYLRQLLNWLNGMETTMYALCRIANIELFSNEFRCKRAELGEHLYFLCNCKAFLCANEKSIMELFSLSELVGIEMSLYVITECDNHMKYTLRIKQVDQNIIDGIKSMLVKYCNVMGLCIGLENIRQLRDGTHTIIRVENTNNGVLSVHYRQFLQEFENFISIEDCSDMMKHITTLETGRCGWIYKILHDGLITRTNEGNIQIDPMINNALTYMMDDPIIENNECDEYYQNYKKKHEKYIDRNLFDLFVRIKGIVAEN